MKNKKWIIAGAILLAVVAVVVAITIIAVNSKYLKKTDYDYVSTTSYNGISIVGEDGEFYLFNGKKKISEAYTWIESVNERYGSDIEEALLDPDAPAKLYNYYIAKKADDVKYHLVDSEGKDYIIEGENYTLASTNDDFYGILPYVAFKNNQTGAYAFVSLNALDSDISKISENKIVLKEFSSAEPVANGGSMYEILGGVIEDKGIVVTYYYNAEGKLITSGKDIRPFGISDEDNTKYFFYNEDDEAIYAVDGAKVAENIKNSYDINVMEDGFVCVARDDDDKKTVMTVVGMDKTITFTKDKYDLNYASVANNELGALLLREKEGTKTAIVTVDSKIALYDNVALMANYLIAYNTGATEYDYIDAYGNFLVKLDIPDAEFIERLSGDGFYCFLDGDEFVIANDAGVSKRVKNDLNTTYILEDRKVPVYSEVTVAEDGKTTTKLLTPFAETERSEAYYSIQIVNANGLRYAFAKDIENYEFVFIDVISNKVVATHKLEKEDFASADYDEYKFIKLVTDNRNANSVVPVTIIKREDDLSRSGGDKEATYFALYRAAKYGTDGYDSAAMELVELGNNLNDKKPITLFEEEGRFAVNTASGSAIYCVGEDGKLKVEGTFKYFVHDIIRDTTNGVMYAVVINSETFGDDYRITGKYGLYSLAGEEIVAPYYTAIRFVDGEYIGLTKNSAAGVLRYRKGKVKVAVDFKYSTVSSIGDNAIVAYDDEGNNYLFNGKKLIMDTPIQNGGTIKDISQTEEGYKCTNNSFVMSDGVIYIHKSDVSVDICASNSNFFEAPENSHPMAVLNRSVGIVYYYKDDACVGSDIIFNDTYSRGQFLTDNDTTFDSQLTDKWSREPDGESLVTKEQILNNMQYGGNIMTLYYVG